MTKLIVFILLSAPILWLSWRSLFGLRHHGLYRFISWECILWLFLCNYPFWFADPSCVTQIVSWLFLIYALVLLVLGAVLMRNVGDANTDRTDDSLFQFEKTTKLVETGIFRYVRHPLYGSLIFLTWGIFFKNTNLTLFAISSVSTIFLVLTSLVEEKEDIEYFGKTYLDYMRRTKMFVPFVL